MLTDPRALVRALLTVAFLQAMAYLSVHGLALRTRMNGSGAPLLARPVREKWGFSTEQREGISRRNRRKHPESSAQIRRISPSSQNFGIHASCRFGANFALQDVCYLRAARLPVGAIFTTPIMRQTVFG